MMAPMVAPRREVPPSAVEGDGRSGVLWWTYVAWRTVRLTGEAAPCGGLSTLAPGDTRRVQRRVSHAYSKAWNEITPTGVGRGTNPPWNMRLVKERFFSRHPGARGMRHMPRRKLAVGRVSSSHGRRWSAGEAGVLGTRRRPPRQTPPPKGRRRTLSSSLHRQLPPSQVRRAAGQANGPLPLASPPPCPTHSPPPPPPTRASLNHVPAPTRGAARAVCRHHRWPMATPTATLPLRRGWRASPLAATAAVATAGFLPVFDDRCGLSDGDEAR